jgi:hypothetical protein
LVDEGGQIVEAPGAMIETLAVKVATAVAQRAAGESVAPLVRDLIGAQNEQIAKLERLDASLNQLMDAPVRRASVYLDEALRDNTERGRRENLSAARAALIEAYSVRETGTIAAQLALVVGVLGDADGARKWAHTAYERQQNATQQLAKEAEQLLSGPSNPLKRLRRSAFWTGVYHAYEMAAAGERLAHAVARETPASERPTNAAGIVANTNARFADFHPSESKERGPLAPVYLIGTPEGRCLVALEQSAADAAEYRQVLLRLDPSAIAPEYSLRLSLNRPTRFGGSATIAWTRH